jgi:hypothetical protein
MIAHLLSKFIGILVFLVFPRRQGYAPTLEVNVREERDHSGVVRSQGVTFERVSKAPIDHLEEGNDPSDLLLKFGIGLGMGVGSIRMTLVAGNFIFPKAGAVEKLAAFVYDRHELFRPALHVLFGEVVRLGWEIRCQDGRHRQHDQQDSKILSDISHRIPPCIL